MIQLLKYEFRKFRYTKKNIIILLVLFLYLSGFIFYNYQLDKNYNAHQIIELKNTGNIIKNNILGLEEVLKQSENEKLESEKKYWHNALDKCHLYLSGYLLKTSDTEFLKQEIEWYEVLLEGESRGFSMAKYSNLSIEDLDKYIKIDQYLIDKNMNRMSSPYSINTVNLIYLLFNSNGGWIIALLLVFFMFDVFGIEFDILAYKMIYSFKYSKVKIMISKLLFSFFAGIAFLAFFIILLYLSGMVFGFGDFNYPCIVESKIELLGLIDIKMITIMFLSMLFQLGCMTFFTVLLLSSMSSFIVTIATIAVSYMLSDIVALGKWRVIVPLFYPDIPKILTFELLPMIFITLFLTLILIMNAILIFLRKNLVLKS